MLVPGVVPPNMQDFALPPAELHEVLLADFYSLLMSCGMAAQLSGISATPPSFVSSAKVPLMMTLSPAVKPVSTLPHCLLIQPVHQ